MRNPDLRAHALAAAGLGLGLGLCLGLSTLCLPSRADAAGFYVGTQDARATAMATAVTADIDDAAAAFYNPAGIAQGKHFEIRLGDTLVIPMYSVDLPAGSTSAKAHPVPPPHLYAYYGLTEDAAVGLALLLPFGLDITWPEDWPGRFQATYSSLRNYYINPEVAYRFLGRIRVGAGVQIVRATVDLKRDINFVDSVGRLELAGGAWGVGGNAGLQVELFPKSFAGGQLYFGAAYRSPISLSFNDGRADFSDVPAELASTFKDQRVRTSVTLPQLLSLGVAWRFHELRLGVDTEYTGWQTVHSLELEFDDPTLNQTLVKRFKHTWNLHVGAELGFPLGDHRLLVRAGILWDPSPSPPETLSPNLPDADRINFAAGLGYRWGGFAADLGYQYVHLLGFDSTYAYLPASYGGNVQVVGLTLGFRH